MSQHDMNITTSDANTGATMRAQINLALQALASQNSGATEPSTTYAYMLWADTTNDLLKIRNAANTTWISFYKLSTAAALTAAITNGTINNTPIGGTTPSTGAFTTVRATADAILNGLTVGRGAGNVASNTATGATALRDNTTGSYNTANGVNALLYNTTGGYNTVNGGNALYSNTTGSYNTATGATALRSNTTGSYNTANGYPALLYNTTGSYNTANGVNALYSNTTGDNNTATGATALRSNTTGSYNTANGYQALRDNTTGSGNICIGSLDSSGNYAPVFNCTTENHRIVMGSTAVTNAYIQVAWTVTSDARDKMNFAPVEHGLAFVEQLQPVSFQFRESRDSDIPTGRVRYGFKAQDILALEGDNPVIIDNDDADYLRYNGEALIPVLVKAIQELKAEFDAYKSTHL